MSSQQKSAKPLKTPAANQPAPPRSSFSSSSLSSHLAMVELKQKILNSLSRLADRDTHQIALEDLEKIIHALSNDGVSIFLNCLYDAANDPKPAVKKEGVHLFAALCAAHSDSAGTHLTKIIAHIVKRLKDTDSQVRDACLDTIGSLAGLYMKGGGVGGDGMVSLFVKPLFEAMNENNKAAQGGAALGLAKVVECAAEPPLSTFQKLVVRVCKYLNSSNFMAKAPLLQALSSLSQVGAVTPQSFEAVQQSIHVCLCSSDWATRKAAADSLVVLGLKTSVVTEEAAASTVKVLETCRFDKIKPARESVNEALQLWKKISGNADGSSDDQKFSFQDGDASEFADGKNREGENPEKDYSSSSALSPSDPNARVKGNNIFDKAVGILKKKAPAFSDKELNPEFFQKLEETRGSGDIPVEVILPRRCAAAPISEITEGGGGSSGLQGERTAGLNSHSSDDDDRRGGEDPCAVVYPEVSSNKGNWLAIQRQLSHLERQQAHLMNMLQDFMGGSHDSMVTMENRVHGLERVVENMVRDLSLSSSKRGGGGNSLVGGVEGSSGRYLGGRYNGCLSEYYSGGKFGRVGSDGRINLGERFPRGGGPSSSRRAPPDASSNSWNFHSHGRNGNGTTSSRRAGDGERENESDHAAGGGRRGWEKGPVRFGEGPSARSVWQASKDEATLEAIRVAGEENGAGRSARMPGIRELTAEALADDDDGASAAAIQDRNPVWNSWSNAMDALENGDLDSAYAQVLSIGDDALLVKLMDMSGPVIDQLSNDVAVEAVVAVSQFLVDPNLFDLCLFWIQQLADIVMENGADVVDIPMEVQREIVVNLQDLSSMELPEDWEGPNPEQLLLQLASAWRFDSQDVGK